MARGDMSVVTKTGSAGAEIMNRELRPGEPLSMTLDFTNVSTTDSETGEKVVKAGTPINGSGVPVSETPWTGAVGILLYDVYEGRPQGAIVRKGYINTGRAQTNSSLTYDAALVAALINAGSYITFEEPAVAATLS